MEIPVLLSLLIVGFGASEGASFRFAAEETEDAVTPLHFLSDDYIMKINTEQDQWEAGRNFDANTPLEDIQILLGTRMDNRDQYPNPIKSFDREWPEENEIPIQFDAREKWGKICPTIGEVLDQGRCGSCWAIAAAQAFSDRYCIATEGRSKARLSTDQVLSCCTKCGDGCDGGWENIAWRYFSKQGLVSGGNYNTADGCQPYSIQSPCHPDEDVPSPFKECLERGKTPQCHMNCTNPLYWNNFNGDKRFTRDYYQIDKTETAIQRDIMKYGPITVSFIVHEDFLNYKKGVYEPLSGSREKGGHAVKLIGWGVSEEKPYWLVMNSWNVGWGDKGLAKLKRGSYRINLEDAAFGGVPAILD